LIRKLAFIIPSLGAGGAERVVTTLAQSLSADFEAHIFVKTGAARPAHLQGVTLHELPFTADSLRATLDRLQIDLVFDHYHWDKDHVRLMADLADEGVKIVLTEHNAFHYPLFQWANDGKAGYQDWFGDRYSTYRRFAGVTVLTDDALEAFGAHLDNLRKVPNPLPTGVWPISRPTGPMVLNISHFRKRAKRLDLLYDSMGKVQRQVQSAHLTIVGDYDWQKDQWLRRAYRLRDGQITCPGRSQRVGDYYQKATAFALTSDIEGQPIVLLEAAMHAVPQVAFDLPGLRDQIIDGETGLLAPFGDTDAFAAHLVQILSNPMQAAKMGQAARAFVAEKFSLQRIRQDWLDIIAEIDRTGRLRNVQQPVGPCLAQKHATWTGYWQSAAVLGQASQPKVSFIVPVYGTEALLGRCLHSIQRQSLAEFECIVVDDASPGDVQAAFSAAVGNDARFRLVRHEENRGLYQARSTGAQQASGLYLAHIDSDDYIHTRFAEIMFAEAMITGAEIVECQAVELHPNGRPIWFNKAAGDGPLDGTAANSALINDSLRNVVWNKIYARDLWARVPDHDQIDIGLSVTEDLLRNCLIFPQCKRYSFVRDCLYYYCRRSSSLAKGGDMDRLISRLRDIDFSYSIASNTQKGPGAVALIDRLEERRVQDVLWYIGEYVERQTPESLRAELRRHKKRVDPYFIELVLTSAQLQTVKKEYRHRTEAWIWERKRADWLQTKVQKIKSSLHDV
jgi:glycosyltransferase involved in cell wall biosynthesis